MFKYDATLAKNLCIIGGHSKNLYDNVHEMVALKIPEQQDRLSQFVEDHLGYLFKVRLLSFKVYNDFTQIKTHRINLTQTHMEAV